MSPPVVNPDRDLGTRDSVLGGFFFRGLTGRLRQVTGNGRVGAQCFYLHIDYLSSGARWYQDDNLVVITRDSFEGRNVVLGIRLPAVVKEVYVRVRREQVDAGCGLRLQDPVTPATNMYELTINDLETYRWVRLELEWLKRVCYACYHVR